MRLGLDLTGLVFWTTALFEMGGSTFGWVDRPADLEGPSALWLLALPASQIALFAVSALYHGLPWTPVWKQRWQRADHSMIYVKIAGSVTAIVWLANPTSPDLRIVAGAWAVAAIGIAQKIGWPSIHEKASIPVQTAQACLAVPALLVLSEHAPGRPTQMALVAAVAYTAGLLVFVTRRPDPWPRWFSFHDVFHVLLLVGSFALYQLFDERRSAIAWIAHHTGG